MIQMIPEHPETPLLHLHGGRGFEFFDVIMPHGADSRRRV
jgi:hypothetical protein